MLKPLTLLAALALSPLQAQATTILQFIDARLNTGPYTGERVFVQYSYPALPAGQDIWTYSPDPWGYARFLDAYDSNLTHAQLVFSGDGDILRPEPYLTFTFDPARNAAGLQLLEIWNVSVFGLYFAGAPDIQAFRCGRDAECRFSTAIVPLPPAGVALGLGLAGLWALRRRMGRPG